METNEKHSLKMVGRLTTVVLQEKFEFVLDTDESITINRFVFILSFSRDRIYCLPLTKSFKATHSVPEEIVTDNMRIIMDIARTKYSKVKSTID